MVTGRIRALTARRPIKPTSPRCHSAWQPNPGRGSTYRRGNSVQTTGTSSAIDAATGETKWVFDPKIYENGLGIPANDGWLHRGVAYWRNGDDERVVILT